MLSILKYVNKSFFSKYLPLGQGNDVLVFDKFSVAC